MIIINGLGKEYGRGLQNGIRSNFSWLNHLDRAVFQAEAKSWALPWTYKAADCWESRKGTSVLCINIFVNDSTVAVLLIMCNDTPHRLSFD